MAVDPDPSDTAVPTIAEARPANQACSPCSEYSNPQQGYGAVITHRPMASAPPPGADEFAENKLVFARPSLKIPPTQKDSRKLFVGGLPADISDDEFRTFFEQFGPVMDSIVMFDRETHRSRGFGFVTFENVESARRILEMGGADLSNNGRAMNKPQVGRLQMRDKTIEVKEAEPKEARSAHRSAPYGRGPGASLLPPAPWGALPTDYGFAPVMSPPPLIYNNMGHASAGSAGAPMPYMYYPYYDSRAAASVGAGSNGYYVHTPPPTDGPASPYNHYYQSMPIPFVPPSYPTAVTASASVMQPAAPGLPILKTPSDTSPVDMARPVTKSHHPGDYRRHDGA